MRNSTLLQLSTAAAISRFARLWKAMCGNQSGERWTAGQVEMDEEEKALVAEAGNSQPPLPPPAAAPALPPPEDDDDEDMMVVQDYRRPVRSGPAPLRDLNRPTNM